MATDTGEVRLTSSTGGQKGTKPARFDLIPPGPLTDLARVYGEGAKKYDDHNWLKGYDWSLSYAALQRHLNAFWGGEDIDPESGQPHMAHAAWHCFTLLEFMHRFPEFDNRPPRREAQPDTIIDVQIGGTVVETFIRPGEITGGSIEPPLARGGYITSEPPDPPYLVN